MGQNKQKLEERTGKTSDNRAITSIDLKKILADHKKWFESGEEAGKRADLSEADLIGANLQGAILNRANLRGANLIQADLTNAYLRGADLSGANLYEADLKRAHLDATNLNKAYLRRADLSDASLNGALLSDANLSGTNLRGTILFKANLRDADLSGTNLSGAILGLADLGGVIFEPSQESISKIKYINQALNLSELRYINSPKALTILRGEFKESGYPDLEREITRAIKHTQMLDLWKEKNLLKKIEAGFYYVFLELTCQYGMKPFRLLFIIVGLIPFFSFFYILAIKAKRQDTGDMLIYSKQLYYKTNKGMRPLKLMVRIPTEKKINLRSGIIRSYRIRMIWIALSVSFSSATRISWQGVNIAHWIKLLQWRDHGFVAKGWVRAVSGFQSLISYCLLALFLLTFFRWPF